MNTEKFTALVRAVTGKNLSFKERVSYFESKPAGEALEFEKRYTVILTLPISGERNAFEWITPKSEEKMLRSFITAFTSKFREPNPATYAHYGEKNRWESMSEERREGAYGHHVSHMYSKQDLMKQIEARFASPEMETCLNQSGFYVTEYGIGIFCFWLFPSVLASMEKMRKFLKSEGFSASEEFSDARWAYRFRIEAGREIHQGVLSKFCNLTEKGGLA
jgi:hypothetical protein